MCLCGLVHMSAAHGGQRDALYLEFQTDVSCPVQVLGTKPGCWELPLGPLQERRMFLTTEPSLLPFSETVQRLIC